MRALVKKDDLYFCEDYPLPTPSEREALIKVKYAGICNTDLEILKGYMNFNGIPGHEFAGVVEKCADPELIGKRVTGEINISCGTCPSCLSGLKNHCPHRSVLGILGKDGAFADYLTLPVENLHVIPDSVSNRKAVFAEPLAASFEIMEQVKIGAGERVCVLGDGKLGLLIAQVLHLTGCDITAVGRHREKLYILENRNINTSLGIPQKRVFDIVVDATGSSSALEIALNVVKPKGKIIIKSTVTNRREININRVVIDEITLIGSRCGPFLPALKALESKSIDVEPLISKIYPIEDGIEAIKYASKRGVIKVLLEM